MMQIRKGNGTREKKNEKSKEIKDQINEKLPQLRELEIYLQKITPFHERLDPESTFYKHYMQKVDTEKFVDVVNQRAAEDSRVL